MRRTIMTVVISVLLGIAITIGWSELYSRNTTFRRGYVGYANAVAERAYDTLQAVGIRAPKITVVE